MAKFNVTLVNFSNPMGGCLVFQVEADDAISACTKATEKRPDLFATSAELVAAE